MANTYIAVVRGPDAVLPRGYLWVVAAGAVTVSVVGPIFSQHSPVYAAVMPQRSC